MNGRVPRLGTHRSFNSDLRVPRIRLQGFRAVLGSTGYSSTLADEVANRSDDPLESMA